MDWFISCGEMEPADAQGDYSERLALLPGLGTRYAIPQAAPTGTRADYGKKMSAGSQYRVKIPNGIAVMFTSHHEAVTSTFAVRLHQVFQRRGIDLHDRTVFMSGQLTHADYLRLNELCDVMLDTVHWSGGNTSLDALASGLPIVTLPGHLMRGRQSQAMLRAVGAGELIAKDADDYVAKAVGLGRDRELRRSLSERILANRGELFERDEPVRALERFLEDAARRA